MTIRKRSLGVLVAVFIVPSVLYPWILSFSGSAALEITWGISIVIGVCMVFALRRYHNMGDLYVYTTVAVPVVVFLTYLGTVLGAVIFS